MVVDGARLALFRNDGQGLAPKLRLIEEERDVVPPTSEIGADRPGRSFQSTGSHRSAYEQTDFHQAMEDRFTGHACARLTEVLKDSDAGAVLIAAPAVLGQMRQQMEPGTRQRLIAEIDRNYAGHDPEEIEQLLERY